MAVSKAQQRAQNKWINKTYDRINLTLPKGRKEVVQAHAESRGESVNGFIGRAINETMERDISGAPPESTCKGQDGPGALPSGTPEAVQGNTGAAEDELPQPGEE